MPNSDDISAEHISELIERAATMPHGPSQVSVAEDAVRLADLRRDDGLSFRARKELIESTIFSGFPEKTLVAFAWCLSLCDREPESFKEKEWLLTGADLLWCYKWVIENAPNFPQIGRQQLDETIEDMERRYTKYGLSRRPVLLQRTRLAMGVEHSRASARAAFEGFLDAPRDEYADCEACEVNFEVEYLLFTGENERAFERAAPLLEKGLACGEVPHVTFAQLLRPFVEAGRLDDAEHCRRVGYRMCAGQQNFLGEVGFHLDFESARGGRQVVTMIERHLPIALATLDGTRRFRFYWALRNTARRLAERGREVIALRLPKRVVLASDPEGRPRTDALLGWSQERVDELAAAFDARNGTDAYARLASDPGMSAP